MCCSISIFELNSQVKHCKWQSRKNGEQDSKRHAFMEYLDMERGFLFLFIYLLLIFMCYDGIFTG